MIEVPATATPEATTTAKTFTEPPPTALPDHLIPTATATARVKVHGELWRGDCGRWYHTEAVPVYLDKEAEWIEYHGGLVGIIRSRTPEDVEGWSAALRDGSLDPNAILEANERRSAALDEWEAEEDVADLDGVWDDSEMLGVASAAAETMKATAGLVALDDDLGVVLEVGPFSGSDDWRRDLNRTALGLLKACGLD